MNIRISHNIKSLTLKVVFFCVLLFPAVTFAAADLTYHTTVGNTADLTTYTFSNVNIGTAAYDRCVIVSAHSRKAGAAATLSSVSIGGSAATILIQNSNTVTNTNVIGLASRIVPAGSTTTIAVTWSEGMLRSQIGVWTATGLADCTNPYDSDSSIATDPSVALDIPENGIAIGAGQSDEEATWTGLTENYDQTLEVFIDLTAASAENLSTEIGRTVTINYVAPTEPVGIFASWAERPEGISLSGTLYESDGVTPLGGGITITAGVGTSTPSRHSTTTAADGSFSIEGIIASELGAWATTTLPYTNTWTGVAYGNGRFVAVGDTGPGTQDVMYSDDGGLTWTAADTADDRDWSSITYGDGQFVIADRNGSINYSRDGSSWVSTSIPSGAQRGIAYGNGTFVMTNGGVGFFSYSTDGGMTWGTSSVPTAGEWEAITYAENMFVAISNSFDVATSTDGITWNGGDNNFIPVNCATIYDVAYGNGRLVAPCYGEPFQSIYSDNNGVTWTSVEAMSANDWGSVTYANGLFIAIADSGTDRLMYSSNGATWTFVNIGNSGDVFNSGIAYGAGRFVSVHGLGTERLWLADAGFGEDTPITLFVDNSSTTAATTITYGINNQSGTTTIAGIDLYEDTVRLQHSTTSGEINLADADFYDADDDMHILIDSDTSTTSIGSTATSSHFIVATGTTLFAPQNLLLYGDVTQNGELKNERGQMYIVGNDPLITGALTEGDSFYSVVVDASTVGNSWTGPYFSHQAYWYSVAYGGGLYAAVACGTVYTYCDSGYDGNRVMTSPDGVNWTERIAPDKTAWYSVIYADEKFVAVGDGTTSAESMYSLDGITWATTTAAGNNDNWQSVTYGEGLFVAVGQLGDRVMTSADGVSWSAGSAAGNNDSWKAITYGNGRFVAVGDTGDRVMYSDDGITWATTTAAENNDGWDGITYADGRFVAVGDSGDDRVMYSNDGITWTTVSTLGDNDYWYDVAYGNSHYVAVGDCFGDDCVMISPDALSWTSAEPISSEDWTSIIFADGRFVSTGLYTGVMVSEGLAIVSGAASSTYFTVLDSKKVRVDGSLTVIDDVTNYGSLEVVGDTYLTGSFTNHGEFSNQGLLYLSGDSEILDASASLGASPQLGAVWVQGSYVATSFASTSALTIDQAGSFTAPPYMTIAGDFTQSGSFNHGTGTLYIEGAAPTLTGSFVGANALYDVVSTPSLGWTSTPAIASGQWRGLTHGNGTYVAVAYNAIQYSSDGITWATTTSPSSTGWYDVAYGGGIFVGVGAISGNRAMSSTNGSTWTTRSAAGNNDGWSGVTHGNGTFVAVGDSGTDRVMTSTNGTSWNARSAAGNNDGWQDVVYGNGRFVAVGHTGDRVMYSNDNGLTWATTTAAGDNDSWYGISYGNGRFVAVGTCLDIVGRDCAMSSKDGITWTASTIPGEPTYWTDIVHADGLFVASSDRSSDALTSEDGITWVRSVGVKDATYNIAYANSSVITVSGSGIYQAPVADIITTFSNNASTSNLSVTPASTLTAPSQLTVAGNFSQYGDFVSNSGTVTFTGESGAYSNNLTLLDTTSLSSFDATPRGIEYMETGDILLLGDATNKIYHLTFGTPGDISTLSLVASMTLPVADIYSVIELSENGEHLYVAGVNTTDDIYQYNFTVPFDLSTAAFYATSSIVAQDGGPYALYMRADGAQMYLSGSDNDSIFEYSLATPFDITTKTYVQSLYTGYEDTIPFGVEFTPDGYKMFITGSGIDTINEYVLGIAWDVSTAQFRDKTSVSAVTTNPQEIAFADSGKIMYLVEANTATLAQFSSVGEAYHYGSLVGNDSFNHVVVTNGSSSLASAASTTNLTVTADGVLYTPGSLLSVAGNVVVTGDIIADAGTTYLTGASKTLSGTLVGNNALNDVSVAGSYSTSDELETADFTILTGGTFTPKASVGAEVTLGVAGSFENTGTFTHNNSHVEIISAPQLLGDVTFAASTSIAAQDAGGVWGVQMSLDGTRLYVLGDTNDQIYEYSLSTPFDVSTKTYIDFFDVTAQDSSVSDIALSSDGTKLYYLGDNNDRISEYALLTPWDVSTAVFTDFFSVAAFDAFSGSITFSPDGKYLVTFGRVAEVNVFILGTPWDVSTASHVSTRSLSSSINPDIIVSGDGTQFFLLDTLTTPDRIEKYILSTPWDAATMVQDTSDSFIFPDSAAYTSIVWADNNSKIVSLEATNDRVNVFDVQNIQTLGGNLVGGSAFADISFSNATAITLTDSASSTSQFTINTGSPVVVDGEKTLDFDGDYTNNGYFIASTSQVLFSGITPQVATGTMTGASAFHNLTVSNTIGNGTTSQSVIFGTPVESTGTFTMLASTSAAFAAGATSTFSEVTWQGISSTSPVWLRSSENGTEWYLDVQGAQSVEYVNVKDSNASIGNQIEAATSTDAGNNTNWDFGLPASTTLSSAANQSFFVGSLSTPISMITIVDAQPTATITTTNDIRIVIATSSVAMSWDATDTTAVFGGSAAAKVSSTVSYGGNNSVLIIDVTSDFVADDTLTVSGLSFTNFTAPNTVTSTLSLRVGGSADTVGDAFDDKTITIVDGGLWNDEDWTLYDTITIDEANIDADLTDFPVYIDMSDLTPQFWATVLTDGGDIRIMTDDLTTELPREVVSIDTTTDTGELYFKADSISGTVDTVFRIYYNGVTPGYASSDDYGAYNVWTNQFALVSHDGVTDSTVYNTTGTRVGNAASTSVISKVGEVSVYADGTGDYVDFNTSNMDSGAPDLTVSLFSYSLTTGSDRAIWSRRITTSANDDQTGVRYDSAGSLGGGTNVFNYQQLNTLGAARREESANESARFNQWQHLAYTADGAVCNPSLYIDGTPTNSAGSNGSTCAGTIDIPRVALFIGTRDLLGHGYIDEVRVATTTRSASWVKAEYENLSTTTEFYTVESSEPPVVGSLTIGEHSAGQVRNVFTSDSAIDAPVLAFTLTPNDESVNITELVIQATNISKVTSSSTVTDWRLYRDYNSNGELDGGDEQIGGAGLFEITGNSGTITFSTAFSATTSLNYIVTADINGIESGSKITLDLRPDGLTGIGISSATQVTSNGAVDHITHLRNRSGGGGTSINFTNVGVVGVGNEGGGSVSPGEELGGLPNFNVPTNDGNPHNEWTDGGNAYLSDEQYATEATVGQRQSYDGYGFSIPNGNQIDGIVVKIEASDTVGDGYLDVGLSWNGGGSITATTTTGLLSSSDSVYTLGSPSDLWGRSWTVSDFEDENFGIRLIARPGTGTVHVDAISVRIYHSATGGGSGGGTGEI